MPKVTKELDAEDEETGLSTWSVPNLYGNQEQEWSGAAATGAYLSCSRRDILESADREIERAKKF